MRNKFLIFFVLIFFAILTVLGVYLLSGKPVVSLIESRIVVEREGIERPAVELKKPLEIAGPIELEPKSVIFKDGTKTTFSLAGAFDLSIAAEDLGKARFMATSPDNRIFIPDMVNWNLSKEGRIIILEDFDEETKRFNSKSVYLSGLRTPNSVAFYTDKDKNDWIYIALTDRLIRYPYKSGDMVPSGKSELITHFPNWQNPDAIGIVWHITRTIFFHEDTLYVSVGSGCNLCEEKEGEVRAMIVAMDPDGGNMRVYAEGLRNAVGIVWAKDSLFATENGVDHLGDDAPDDLMYKITEGEHYGWPYCYELDGENLKEPSWKWKHEPVSCEKAPLSFAEFGPHSAPLGITYFKDAHPLINNTFLVALHGSHNVKVGNGYRIVRVSMKGVSETFMEGFLKEGGVRLGRPVHILQKDNNSFLFTDDFGGRLYYVYAK